MKRLIDLLPLGEMDGTFGRREFGADQVLIDLDEPGVEGIAIDVADLDALPAQDLGRLKPRMAGDERTSARSFASCGEPAD